MKKEAEKTLKLIAIKTKSKVYISDNINNSSYFNSNIKKYIFDGSSAQNTYKSDWFEIAKLPVKVEVQIPKQVIKSWYELKENLNNTGLPKLLQSKDFAEDGEYESVYGLYQIMKEYDDGGVEEVPFELIVIEELDEFEITRSDFKLEHSLLDRITTHPVLLVNKPCRLSAEESYRVIRNYIKQNINHDYAAITSDYDFCFTVSKRIKHDPEEYRVNIGKRKPIYETRYRRERTVKVFEVAPKAYQSYPIVKSFEGKNEEDLKQSIDKYLCELIEIINKPYIECEHCNGLGVKLEEVEKVEI